MLNRKTKKNKKKKTGFTLVEILVVILIIGLLFIMLVPRLSSMDEASRQAGVKTKFKEFQTAAKTVMLENAGLTNVMSSSTDVAGLVRVLNKELDDANKFDTSTIQGQYCDSNAVDPWNNHYRLHVNDNTITFISYGSNPVTVHAAEFDYAAENCKYILVIIYEDGQIIIKTEGFTVNIEDVNETGSAVGGGEQIVATPEDCFSWNGTTITGFSGTCGHTDEEHANIVIPNRCTAIGASAFDSHTELISVVIPNSVTTIGHSAFGLCANLETIKLPDGLTSIENWMFNGCRKLKNLTIPNSVTSIGGYSIRYCKSLTSITIPNSVTSIGDAAFEDAGLTSISIPNSVTSIGSWVFCNCKSLTSVTIPNSIKYIKEYTFLGCTSLTELTLPNDLRSIFTDAFANCTSLASVTIPNSVTYVETNAFKGVQHIEYHGTASGGPWGALSMN